jgi:hypothetical protein
MVGAVAKDETLVIQVARGTDVLERHEQAVVDICSISETGDKDVEDCVVNFLADGYYEDIGGSRSGSSSSTRSKGDNDESTTGTVNSDESKDDIDNVDADELIDDMFNLWVAEDDLPVPPTNSGIVDSNSGQQQNQKPKPWSSRSSPSGTFVRDPKTGQMKNIDP